MIPYKKPYVKPEVTIIRLGTPKCTEIIAMLKAENDAKQQSIAGPNKQ